MRIRVDPSLCQGHNRCYALAPDLFSIDELGLAEARNGGRVPAGQENLAQLAIDNCPEFAIAKVTD